MGTRISDEFTDRNCSFLSPAETVKSLLPAITRDAFGLTIELTAESIKYEKRNHFYNLTYRQSNVAKSIFSLCEDAVERVVGLEPEKLIAGFLYGVLQTV